jgi:hypothetical protein
MNSSTAVGDERGEGVFLTSVRTDVGEIGPDASAMAEMGALSVEPAEGQGPSYYLRDHGTWDRMREYLVHRSLYHLTEADPHAWVIPRLTGQAKASFVAIEFDEHGGGRGARVHQQLYADLMAAAGLDSRNLGYLQDVSAEALASVNLMSMFGCIVGFAVRLLVISRRPRLPRHRVHVVWRRRWSALGLRRRASASIVNMSRPMRSMSRSCVPVWC